MDDFSLAFEDNRQALSVATTATTLAQLTSHFDDLHLGNGDATTASLLNGLVGGGLHGHHTLASLAAVDSGLGGGGGVGGGLLDRAHLSVSNGGPQSNVLDTFVAMVNGLTGGVGSNGTGNGGGGGGSTGPNNAVPVTLNGGSKLEERPVKYKSHTECVPVPSSEHVAEIVGRQGCKIKALRAKTNTFIKTPIRGEEPIFVITGTKEDVTRAKQEILSAADHFSTLRSSKKQAIALLAESRNMLGYSMPDEITIQIRVPQKVVGLVVGPKGATIKNIQLKTNTYIITPKRNQESVFEITGLPTNVHTARQLIEEHIATRAGATSAGGGVTSGGGSGGGGGGGGGGTGGSSTGSGGSGGSSSSSSSSSTTSSSGSSSSSSGHGGGGGGLASSGSSVASSGNGPSHLGCLAGSLNSGSASSLIGGLLGGGGGGGGGAGGGLLLANGNHHHQHHHHHMQQEQQQQQQHYHHHHHPGSVNLNGAGLSSALSAAGGGGLVGETDFDGNQFIIENLLEYFNNMSGSSAFHSPTTATAVAAAAAAATGADHIPDFRSIWENLSESQTSGATTDTDNSSLVWTLPSSSRNSVSYSPDDFIFQR
ncbi:RNA-binding E3 ubiquitin-protein ligase MEX3C-like [Anopheles ziemanni]|uniref:RNA-binding E3 ubiquitin-protein ligase MEX3C-like n=1 Tax=Anopheles coustani TaxID=139045 RepID=UPI00265B38BB|nr:RNA-binding E3 ubiquitin-protein ligase MEX3C-like [Anopheles coustani]XP_058176481.1 RNA-binding E3 ubiquitin-protein ligase MEX3C-like [Anopheles ziemanni]